MLSLLLLLSAVLSDAWTPPTYNSTLIDACRHKILLTDIPQLTHDPYHHLHNTTLDKGVCAVHLVDSSHYQLLTYDSPEAAHTQGSSVTHNHPCGVCSTLQDLAAYMQYEDMTKPVRRCGLIHILDRQGGIKCLESLGLTTPCAQIWRYNTENTKENCLGKCLWYINSPYNSPDGSLNPCLQCDEDQSGPIFKKVAARTRRDSGLASAIYRPPDSIYEVEHFYCLTESAVLEIVD